MDMETLVFLFGFLACVSTYPEYQLKIPNGGMVPDPCYYRISAPRVYPAVGHERETSLLNPFGIAMQEHGYNWTQVCDLDSDGDSRSNGVELGDDHCEWTENGPLATLKNATSHPGIPEVYAQDYQRYKPTMQFENIICANDHVPFWVRR